ncbi:inner membrane protein [Escherichia coli]|uniref:Inner membrane protein n=1 Tax=Escherichia coli TaxID=562 RepID=A0A376KQF0_ECOLX|nr:inner membrane protein [Escherichia coli]
MFSPQSRLRHAVADTFAMVVYCSVVNMCIEVFPLRNELRTVFLFQIGSDSGEHLNCMAIRYVPRSVYARGTQS